MARAASPSAPADRFRTMRRRHWLARPGMRVGVMLAPLLLALLHTLGTLPLSVLDRLDDLIYDTRLRLTMPGTLDERIVIVDIDEKSMAAVGRWPWPRDRVAALLDRLFDEQQVRVVGMDTVFAEPDPGRDEVLARALQGRPVVLGYYFTSDREGHASGQLPAPVLRQADLQGRRVALTRWDGYGANLPGLVAAAPQAGFFNAITDRDGAVRSLPLLAAHGEGIHESLVLALYRRLLGMPVVAPGFSPQPWLSEAYEGLQSVRLIRGDRVAAIPVDGRGAALVPFRGEGGPRGGAFTYIPAADVLQGRLAPGSLQGRIVLLGFTAPGLLDLRATPVGEAYPGVEVHASLLSGLLDGRLPVRPDYARGVEFAVLLAVGLALALLLPRLGAARGALFSLGVLAAVTGLNHALYASHGLVLPLASALVLTVLVFGLHMSWGYLVEGRAKRQLAQVFGTYVPPELVTEMLRSPERYGMAATTREMTVMFCDMKGFTAIAETMEPQQLQALLNEVFSRLSAVVSRHRGTIDKYMGDCLMAFWGAPLETPGHARLAVEAALAIVAEVEALNREHRRRGLPEIGLGVGLSTGPMCVGDMGSDIRRSYTVIGDAVNLGARLEGLSRVYGVDIVASERTRELAPGFAWQQIDLVRVKGKAQAVAIHTPLGHGADGGPVPEDELAEWDGFLRAWRARDWDACEALLAHLLRRNEKKILYRHWAERVALARQAPPGPDWDGATDFTIK